MKPLSILLNRFFVALLSVGVTLTLASCQEEEDAMPPDIGGPTGETPFTSIPPQFVGTWYADHNEGPLSTNWDEGSFQGEQGFREFRTIVLTENGKEAVEYTTEVMNVLDEVKQYSYKLTGTLVHKTDPPSLTFYAQSGKMRVFSNKYTGFQEFDIVQKDIENYTTVLLNPEATTYPSSTNYLNAQRLDGSIQLSSRYIKADGNHTPGNGNPDPSDPYAKPPVSGTYVQIGQQYYPTVTIGDLEWMSVNYAGPGGIIVSSRPEYGTFFKYLDLKNIPVPEGWRIPSKEDYKVLLASQNIKFDEVWQSTDGSDLESKKRLGYLMAKTGWLKQDGYANNQSGFNAVPANLQVTNGNPHGEGTNCYLWTSDKNEEDTSIAFEIIQLPSDTYASFREFTPGYNPPHVPLRLVRDHTFLSSI